MKSQNGRYKKVYFDKTTAGDGGRVETGGFLHKMLSKVFQVVKREAPTGKTEQPKQQKFLESNTEVIANMLKQ